MQRRGIAAAAKASASFRLSLRSIEPLSLFSAQAMPHRSSNGLRGNGGVRFKVVEDGLVELLVSYAAVWINRAEFSRNALAGHIVVIALVAASSKQKEWFARPGAAAGLLLGKERVSSRGRQGWIG